MTWWRRPEILFSMNGVRAEPRGVRTYAVLMNAETRASKQVTVHATYDEIVRGLATLFPVSIRGQRLVVDGPARRGPKRTA